MKLVSVHKLVLVFLFLLFSVQLAIAQQWSLQQCLDSAQVHNKNLQIASNNIELSAERVRGAKSNLLPRLMANADYKYFTDLPHQLMPLSTFNPSAPEGQFKEAQFGVPHNINANLQLAIPIYNSQIYGGIEASKIASEMSALQYQKSKEQIYFEIANLYYNAQILQTQIAFLDSNQVNNNRLLANLDLLHEQLLATGTDVGKVQLQKSQLATQKLAIESKLAQVISMLKFSVGIPEEATFQIERSIDFHEEIAYNSFVSLDSRIAQTNKKLLRRELKTLNHSRFLPNVNLVGSYGVSGFGYDKEPNDFLNFYPIGFAGIQISYSIFNGSTILRKANQKQIELQNNELKLSLAEEKNSIQIANAKMQRSSTHSLVETSKQQIQLAQDIYNNTILLQKEGLASLTEILMADHALREAQNSHLNAIIDYLKADLELKKLTGNIQ